MIKKLDSAYKTIGEVARELNLINSKSGKLNTHTIRFWETQFKQIKPNIRAGKRRYYSEKDFILIKTIMHMLKNQGFTIKGVKKILDNQNININKLDVVDDFNVNKTLIKSERIKKKLLKINKLIKNLKI